jgi:uncharacterized membrane protein (UPF0127 family)
VISFRIIVSLGALLLASWPVVGQTDAPREELIVATDEGERVFQVEIADDPRERSLGLMYRREMANDAGMLFELESDQVASFWMRNTYIPLDMIFIEADGTIESIAERTTPLSEASVLSGGPVRYVLEINGGLSDEFGIEAGDIVSGAAIEARD